MCIFEAVSDSLCDEDLFDFVSAGGLEFGEELSLSFDDFSIFSVSHELKVDSGFSAGDFELGFVDDGDFLFLVLAISHFCLWYCYYLQLNIKIL